MNLKHPTLINDPDRAREEFSYALGCLAVFIIGVCLTWSMFHPVRVLLGCVFIACIFLITVYGWVGQDAAGFLWRETEGGLQPVAAGVYCRLKACNKLHFVPRAFTAQLEFYHATQLHGGREISVQVDFDEEVPSRQSVEAFQCWYAGLVAVCTAANMQELRWRLNQPGEKYRLQYVGWVTSDPIDAYIKTSSPPGFTVQLVVERWPSLSVVPF